MNTSVKIYRPACFSKMLPMHVFCFGNGSRLGLQYGLKNVDMFHSKTSYRFLKILTDFTVKFGKGLTTYKC